MNPVLRKDLLGLLRLKRVAAIQIFFVAVLALLLIVTWPQSGVLGGSLEFGNGADGATAIQDQLLLGLIIGQIVLLVLFVPGIAAVSLSGEREANTLEMLYASRLSPTQIIAGKVWSAISYPVLLLISGLPFVAMLNFRGEANLQVLGAAYLILLLTAVFLAIVSLTISALSQQSATALVISYVTVLIICGGVLVPAAIMLGEQSGSGAQILHYTRSISPVAAALSLLRPQLADFGGQQHELLASWQVFVPMSIAVMLVCFGILVYRLHAPPTSSEGYRAGATAEERRTMGRRIMFLIDPKKRRKPFGRLNPLLAKERRTSSLGSGRWMIRIFYGALFLSLGLAVMSLYGGTEHGDLLRYVAAVLVAFQVGIIALVVPSLSSATISGEIENGTFEMLRMTRLKGGKIFWGKFIPSFLPALLPLIALVPGYGAICFIDPGYLTRLAYILPVIVLAAAFCCTLGLTASAFIDNTARSTVTSYLITAALFVLPLIAWWASGVQITEDVAKWICAVSPLVISLNRLPGSSAEIEALWSVHLIVIGALMIVLLIAARLRLAYLLKKG